jgi:hypothetical protein
MGCARPLVLGAAFALAVAPAAAAAGSAPAASRHRTGVITLSVSAGGQTPAASLTDRFGLERNVETATVDVRYPGSAGTLFDGGVALQLGKKIAAGVSVSRVGGSGSATVDASIPHPLLFQQPRAIGGNQDGIRRAEMGVHLQFHYTVVTKRRLMVVVSAGPSWLAIEQDLVDDVRYDETYPYDAATFRSAPARRSKASAAGINAGADVRWMFNRHFGIGGLVRLTRGSADLDTTDNRRIRVHPGGLQAATGLRVGL